MGNIRFVSLGLCVLFMLALAGFPGFAADNPKPDLTLLYRQDLADLASSAMWTFLAGKSGLKGSIKSFQDEKELARLRKEFPDALIIRDNIGDDGKFMVPAPEFKMLALQGLAFIVNGANPVGSMSRDRIRSLLEGKTIGWRELGGTDTLINLYVGDKSNFVFRRILNAVLGMGKFSEKALPEPDDENMKLIVTADRDAFGVIIFSGPQIAPELRILKIDGVAPSFSGMAVRKYPFSRTIYLYIPEKPSGNAKNFFDFLTSPAGRAVIAKNKMFPLIR